MKPTESLRKIRVMLVEDHVLVRVGLACTVNVEEDMEIVAEAADGWQAVEAYRKHRPDVVILDLRLPGMDGIEVMKALQRESGAVRCIFLSSYEGGDEITRAMQLGARGYVLKSMASENLLAGIRAVYAGERYVLREIAGRMKNRIDSDLSPRELEILHQIALGKSNKEIAAAFDLVEGTVKGHVTNILAKLRAMDRTQAIVFAVQRGIITLK
jgi:DNA-binding NarL/FixJ family response regulator